MQTARRGSEKGASEIDLLTQTFQLAHGARHASLRSMGTLGALDALAKAGLIPEQICRELDHAFVFLRTAEHRAQLGVETDQEKQVRASQARVKEICDTIGKLPDS
jgi:glutamine synthetase adenylyltransferase